MTLLNRVSAFFLAALAIALVGYSAAFYLLARNYLVGQFDDGLHNALRILAASVEVEPDDAKWQPGEFNVEFDRTTLRDVRWIVSDERGQMVDHSPQVVRSDAAFAPVYDYSKTEHFSGDDPVGVGDWRILQKQLNAPQPKPLEIREPHEYAGVRITVARSQAQLTATLNRLAALVVILPAVVWLLAAAGGRSYVRHALEPLRAMADRARSMKQADFSLRLPVDGSQDELAELGTAFNGLLDELQHSYERQHRFTGDAAHQLRTPLAVLQGQIDVALRRPRSGEEHERTLHVLADQVTEFRQIVESLLFLARAEDDAVAPERESIELTPWLTRYLERWHDPPRCGDLALHLDGDARVDVSPPLLSQLLDNLVSNALKYSQPGTPVAIGTHRDGANHEVALSVADCGIGIDAADRAAVFEPFFRSTAARRAGVAGTGLGLAVAARIAAALGGSLHCDSTPGQGSKFSLTLPREQ
jgi:signal transduction histidine kinase